MKLWRRASGAMKDRNSLWMAALSRRRSKYDHPDLEAAVIRATSHDERFVDYKNTQRVFAWIRTSPVHLLPFMRAVSRRLSRTRNSIVAIKGLMLLHGVLCTNTPASRNIGRLPFDLSSFSSSSSSSSSSFNYFVRAYFSFLDQKSVLISIQFQSDQLARHSRPEQLNSTPSSKEENNSCSIAMQLTKVKKWQGLLDMLLDIQPRGKAMMNQVIVLEAMDCVIIEVFDVYSKVCDGIANALVRVYAAGGKAEASMALEVLRTGTRQGKELADYFELCKEIGILNASECPKVERIPQEDITELERIIHGVSMGNRGGQCCCDANMEEEEEEVIMVVSEERERSAAGGGQVVDSQRRDSSALWMTTIITDKWEVFDDDFTAKIGNLIDLSDDDDDHDPDQVETKKIVTYTSAIVPLPDHQLYIHV
ncbi:hypothetical protein Dimus_025814 [Dionaea muscipula]